MTSKENPLSDFDLGIVFDELKASVKDCIARRESCHFMVIYDSESNTISLPVNMGIPNNVQRVSSRKWVVKKKEKPDADA